MEDIKKEHLFINGIEYKHCSSCKQILKLSNYSNNIRSWDGLKPYCKDCASKKGKKYRMENHDKVLKSNHNWYKHTKSNALERTEKQLKVRYKTCTKCGNELNITFFRERANGGFYSLCKKCENEYNKYYRVTHYDTYKAVHASTEQRRRKRAEKTISDFSTSDWRKCKEYFKYKCAYCGRQLNNLTRDHLIPLSKGGNYTKNNIIPACRNCNSQKHNKDFRTWYTQQGFYSKDRENKINNYISTL